MESQEYFNLFHNISPADYDLLTENFKTKRFKKRRFLVVPGQIQRELYFVNSGVQMSYFDAGDKIHVIAFTYFPNICAIPGSFSFQAPSKYFLTCLTDSELDYITFQELQRLLDRSQQIERFFRRMTESILAGMINRHIELHAMTIEERYKTFCQKKPAAASTSSP